jgi:hypothetical protein
MEYKGFKASIMEAERLTGEYEHNLPPGSPLEIFHADQFMNLPGGWMRGPGVFIVPVRPNKGLWFNWTMNDAHNTAVLPTVKGCNPITGMQTSGFHLERYESKCPKHGVDFQADRYCPECGYKWPFQNYVAIPSTLWWDGFRANDGSVRQFFFTEDEMRDVAQALIGKENTVPAFGFAFYKPKEARTPPASSTYRGSHFYNSLGLYEVKTSYGLITDGGMDCGEKSLNFDSSLGNSGVSQVYYSSSQTLGCSSSDPVACAAAESHTPKLFKSKISTRGIGGQSVSALAPVKEVSIGAGAKIRQDLQLDPYPLDSWCEKPGAAMTIYFVFHEKFEEIKAGGMRDVEGKPEGMLSGVPVG